MPEIKFCPYCSKDIVEHAKFCYECGGDLTSISATNGCAPFEVPTDHDLDSSSPKDSAPATKLCRYCGETIAAQAQFCRKCGASLTGTRSARAPTITHLPQDDESERFNASYRHSGHEVLTPFHKTIEHRIVCYEGTTKHPNGHTLKIIVYPANSFSEAQDFKEELSSEYQERGYVTHKTTGDTWMGIFEGTLVSVTAKQTSALGVPITMDVLTPL